MAGGFTIRTLFCLSWLLFSSCAHHTRHARRQYYDTTVEVDEAKHASQFFSYVTRPDIDAPRWDLEIYNKERLAPGYIFVATYGRVEEVSHRYRWTGPYIYDQKGELIWAGSPLLDNTGVFNFRVFQVNGKDVLALVNPQLGSIQLLDSSYEITNTYRVGEFKIHDVGIRAANIHELQIHGDDLLAMNRELIEVPEKRMKELGYNRSCRVAINGFQKFSLATGEVLWEWSPEKHISFEESYRPPADSCDDDNWDYAHANSLDVLPDGNYLMSARQANAIYKISQHDGSVIWRLHGKKSDFEWVDNGTFTGQHDARFLSQNETHMLISVMDNSRGPNLVTSWPNSRGLILALDIVSRPMTVREVSYIDHPYSGYAEPAGNVQTLSNGNRFIGWTNAATHSEHLHDGELLMKARLYIGAKSYRCFKFPWIGHPAAPPDVYSEATVDEKGITTTTVYVSWNGATEVARWNVYKTDKHGDGRDLVASKERAGFETMLQLDGFAKLVVVEAIDVNGRVLGSSRVMKTEKAYSSTISKGELENKWLKIASSGDLTNWNEDETFSFGHAIFVAGIVLSVTSFFVALGWMSYSGRLKTGSFPWVWHSQAYELLPQAGDSHDGVWKESTERPV